MKAGRLIKAVGLGFELHELEQFGEADFGFLARDIKKTGEDEEIFANGQVDIQSDFLGHDPGHGLDGPVVDRSGQAVDGQCPRCFRRDAMDHANGRRLAGPVGAEEAETLALADLERDAVDGGEIAVFLDQILGFDDRVHGIREPL
jgi:hypothetical protein